jgi:hypothetical protein
MLAIAHGHLRPSGSTDPGRIPGFRRRLARRIQTLHRGPAHCRRQPAQGLRITDQ